MYNYLPRNEDELELKEGDIVDVMEKCDDGWFVGKRRRYRAVDDVPFKAQILVLPGELTLSDLVF